MPLRGRSRDNKQIFARALARGRASTRRRREESGTREIGRPCTLCAWTAARRLVANGGASDAELGRTGDDAAALRASSDTGPENADHTAEPGRRAAVRPAARLGHRSLPRLSLPRCEHPQKIYSAVEGDLYQDGGCGCRLDSMSIRIFTPKPGKNLGGCEH